MQRVLASARTERSWPSLAAQPRRRAPLLQLSPALNPAPVCSPNPPPCCSAKLKLDRLRRRGKAPPKKGAGKRAGKKK